MRTKLMNTQKNPKIVLAFDKFKGSMTQAEANAAAARGVRAVLPDAEICVLPCADGGEGTVDAFLSAFPGEKQTCSVTPPRRAPGTERIEAVYGVLSPQSGQENAASSIRKFNDAQTGGKTCVMEMSSASGLALVPEGERDPLRTSTYGTGEMILHALDAGCTHFLIGIGGSATNDGGAGMAAALGVRFYDADGTLLSCPTGGTLSQIARIDVSGLDTRVKRCTFTACCDVTNVLCGPNGASAVYAPQKGAREADIPVLDAGLSHLADLLEAETGRSLRDIPGAGAAGGLGMGMLAFLGGTLVPGIDAVLDASCADALLSDASLLLTGEGKIDGQTVCGKTVAGLLRRAETVSVPVCAFGGCVTDDAAALYDAGIAAVFPIADRPMTLEESMRGAPRLLEKQVRAAVSLFTESQS